MKQRLIKLLKRHWSFYLGIIFLFFYIISLPNNKQKLISPSYDLSQITESESSVTFPVFKDITLFAGIAHAHTQRSEQLNGIHDSLGAGVCLFDYDNDGLIDILTLNGAGTRHFYGKPQWWQSKSNSLTMYRNIDGLTFEDVTKSTGFAARSETMGCNAADLDNDGDVDVFITNKGNNQLWLNNGNGTFSNITQQTNITGSNWSTSSRFGDVNKDGLLDIYITNYIDFMPNARVFEENAGYDREAQKKFVARLYPGQANKLYINQGDMDFTESTKAFGVANSQGRGLSSNFIDINNDGWPDLLVANDQDSENKVYLNINGKNFKDISTQSQLAITTGTPSIDTTKLNDHNQSILMSSKSGDHPRLFELSNDTNKSVVAKDISEATKLHTLGLSKTLWGLTIADLNGDGWQDFVFANGSNRPNSDAMQVSAGQPNTLLINNQENGFIDLSELLNPKTYRSLSSRCVASADFNNDGTADLFFTQNNDLPQLLLNQTEINNWIGFELVNQDQYAVDGALIKVEVNGVTQTRYVGQHQGFLCAGDPRILFALGKDKSITKVQITWPNGSTQSVKEFHLNQYNRVTRNSTVTPLANNSIVTTQKSAIRLKLNNHRLVVVGWLIDNNKFEEAINELRQLTQESDHLVRENAYQLAVRLPQPQRRRFIQNAISDDSRNIRQMAIQTVKESEDESLMRWLLNALSDKETKVACAAASAFELFFREEEAVTVRKYLSLDPLIQLASRNIPEAQVCAIKALGESEHYRTLEVLIQRLKDGSEQVKAESAHALGLIKEKSSLNALITTVESITESPIVRATALTALLSIDRHFESKALIDKTFDDSLSNQQIDRQLQMLALIASPEKQTMRVPAAHYLPALINWRNTHLKQFKPANNLSYFKILSRHPDLLSKKEMSLLRQLSTHKKPETRLAASKLLLALEPESKRAKILVSALSDPDISKQLSTGLNHLKLDKKAFYGLSFSLPKAVRLAAIWQFNAEGESKDLQKLIIDTLSHQDLEIEIKRSVISRLKSRPTIVNTLCKHSVLSDEKLVSEVLEQLNGCLRTNRLHKTMPLPLQVALEQNTNANSLAALTILTSRKERWAQGTIRKILLNDDSEFAKKETILANLASIIPQSLTNDLSVLFNQDPNSPVVALITKYHLNSGAAYAKQALYSLKNHVDNGNEQSAMLFADALIATMPDLVLQTLMKPQ